MEDEDAYCIDVLTQISASTRALESVALELLGDHLDHGVREAAARAGPDADAKVPQGPPGHRTPQWQRLWVELWLYGHATERMAVVQTKTRLVITEALGLDGALLAKELAAAIHALWGGFWMYRLTDAGALNSGAFEQAVGWLLDGQHKNETALPKGARL
jgi:hypothetical protein